MISSGLDLTLMARNQGLNEFKAMDKYSPGGWLFFCKGDED